MSSARLRVLLASSSLAALLAGGGAPAAWAACAVNVTSGTQASISNGVTINCINVDNATITGNVTNTGTGVINPTGTVAPTRAGITINNNAVVGGTVSNAGTITSAVIQSIGIEISNNATVVGGVSNSGTIAPFHTGIQFLSVSSFSGGIANSGKILSPGTTPISINLVDQFSGGITNSGTLSGAENGITLQHVTTFSGGIANSATILAGGQWDVLVNATSTFSGGISNGGVMSATKENILISSVATFTGGIQNSGTLSGGLAGMIISAGAGATLSGGISNSGTISAVFNGLNLNANATFSGGITNSGNIAVGFRGLDLYQVSNFSGNVANSGTISAGTAIIVEQGSTIHGSIVDSGVILAGTHGIVIDGISRIISTGTAISVTGSTFTGGITNAGTITTSGASGIGVGLTQTFTGGIANSGTIAANTHALTVAAVGTFAGGISNSGTLTANNAVLLVSNVAVFGTNATGGITNSGTIAGSTAEGIHVVGVGTFNGGIVNSGLIDPRTGISVASVTTFAGGITNAAGGTISASVRGITLNGISTFTGNVSNAGTITAPRGISVTATTINGAIIAGGDVLASVRGIEVDGASRVTAATGAAIAVTGPTFTGGIVTGGVLSAAAGSGIAVVGVSTFTGGIVNQGTITAANAGILVDSVATFVGGISNQGLIDPKTGIGVTNTTTFAGGVVNASGATINATAIGINVANVPAFTGNVSNGGTLTAPTGIRIAGSTITGQVLVSGNLLASGHGILIDSASRITTSASSALIITAPTFTGGISNAGTTTTSGASGIFVLGTQTFTGGIANSGSIAANAHALAMANVSTFAGGITNSGTLAANNAVLLVSQVAVFGTNATGGITNSGTITGLTAEGIHVVAVATFNGGIVNSGLINPRSGISVASVTTFAGGITNAAGGTISASVRGITLNGISTFNGNVSNAGTITALFGISVNASTLNGAIVDSGNILASIRGIAVDSASKVTVASGAAIAVTGATLTGGIINAGLLSAAAGSGIAVAGVTTFGGGVVNSGTISSGAVGILVNNVATFSGGIVNAGLIDPKTGMSVTNTASFTGNVVNASGATINATAIGINVGNVPAFTGNVSNGGTITAPTGIRISGSTISGQIVDTGNLLATSRGILIDGASNVTTSQSAVKVTAATFMGGISNAGVLSSTLSVGIGLSGVATLGGGITNAGTIAGVVGLSVGGGVTFAAGSAIVNSGTITGGAAAIDVFSATSPVTIDQTAGLISGLVRLSANADVLNVSGGTINGNIAGAGSTNTINFALGAGNTFTYASNFTGINQVNVNSGTVILNGANSATKVDVNGGTLAGAGSIDPVAVTIHAGGTFAPGTPGTPGTSMSIVGTLAFQPGATYQVYLNPTSTTSATVSGAVTLAGTVQANFAPGAYVSRSYDILQSGGLGGTTFSGLTIVPPNFDAKLRYTSTDVFIDLSAALGQTGSLTVNQQNVATALNNFFNTGGALPPGFAAVFGLSGASLANALNQLDGEVATGAQRAVFQIGSEFLSLLIDPFVYGRGDAFAGAYGGMLGFAPQEQGSVPAEVALAYASVLKAQPLPLSFEQRWTAWGSVYGGQASAKGDPNFIGSTKVTTGTFGFAGGMDYRLSPDTVVGFGLGAGGTGWGLAQGMGNGRSDTLQAGVYGATHRGPAYAAAAVAFAENWMSTSRTALGDQLTADFTGRSVGARLEAGYRYPLMLNTMALGVAPYAAVQTQWFHTPTYSERDLVPAGFGLTYQAMTANDTRSELGLRLDDLTAINGMPLLLRGRLAWAHDWISNPALTAVFQALPGTNFVVFGAPVAHDTALVSAGGELRITPKLALIGKFDGEFAAGAQTYAGSGTLRYSW